MTIPETFYRFIFLIVLLSAFLISGYYRRKARQTSGTIERRAEGTSILFLRMVGALPLFFSLIAYIVWPRALAWAQIALPAWLRLLGCLLALLCIPLIWWVFTSIGENISETVLTKQEHMLVTHGPYRWVRHPLYASALLLLLSLALVAANWFLGIYALAAILIFRLVVIPKEEEFLVSAFGQAYKDYQQRTGALLPRIA